jgi:hypothetical protein
MKTLIDKKIFTFVFSLFLLFNIYAQDTYSPFDKTPYLGLLLLLPPPTPTNLTATGYSTTELYLTWDNVINESGYYIFTKVGGPYFLIDSTAADVNYYYVQGLTPQTQSCYVVAAYNQDGISAFSNEACGSTLAAINESSVGGLKVKIYPDPAQEFIIIEAMKTSKNKDEIVYIYNVQGQLLLERQMQQDKIKINISVFPNGLYIVRVFSADKIIEKKIIKE